MGFDEAKLSGLIHRVRKLSEDGDLVRSLAELRSLARSNKLRMLFNDVLPDDGGYWVKTSPFQSSTTLYSKCKR